MWNKLHLVTFKSFKEIDIELAPLTVLAGVNSVGKSTVLQALALLSQTILDNQLNQHLCLSGFNVVLGGIDDVVNHTYSRKRFQIGLQNDVLEFTWGAVGVGREASLQAQVEFVGMMENGTPRAWSNSGSENVESRLLKLSPEIWHGLEGVSLFCQQLEQIKYLSSERLGPRDTYPVLQSAALRTVGPQGQFCASYIDLFGDDDALMLSAEGSKTTVRKLIDELTDSFFPGFKAEPRRVDRTSLMSLLIFDPTNDLHRIQNVGFGISHALPIIVQCAGAVRGDTLLIENPESQLHPSAQSKMGQFLAMTASKGVQVIVETHSDHVLNGIRRAVASNRISPQEVCVNFVSRGNDKESTQPNCERIHLTEEGRLMSWPHGFFDQIEEDLTSLP